MSAGRILVVDDEPQIRRVMRTTLVANGYEVVEARNGMEALQEIRENHCDLILLDVNMPAMDGLETCREIRSVRTGADVAIIMLTVRNAEKDKVDALDAGADDYVTKPFGTPELLARIRAALRRVPIGPESGPQRVTLGPNITIDLLTRHVRTSAGEVRLTPKEFQLLRYFLAHPNQSISHRELLQAVWGPDYGEELEYLRVFINQLRKKIEPTPADPKYLLTDPWVGYRFYLPP